MWSSLTGAGSSVPSASDADAIESVRILVVGDAGCGKTSLVQALVQGSAPARPVPTVACSVQVKLIDCAADDSPSSQPRQFFVELWDVGGGRRAAPLRRLFYGDAAGVLLCHDLSRRGGIGGAAGIVGSLLLSGGKGDSSPSGKGSSSNSSSSPAEKAASRAARLNVRAWAAEVAGQGSFRSSVVAGNVASAAAAPSPSMMGHGGSTSSRDPLLPVPVLLVGTKADADPTRWRTKQRRTGSAGGTAALELIHSISPPLAARVAASAGAAGSGGGGGPFAVGSPPPPALAATTSSSSSSSSSSSLPSIRTSAASGDVDSAALDDFFRECIRRRFFGGSGGGNAARAAGGNAFGWSGGGGPQGMGGGDAFGSSFALHDGGGGGGGDGLGDDDDLV